MGKFWRDLGRVSQFLAGKGVGTVRGCYATLQVAIPDAGKGWGLEEKVKQDEMVGWHHQLNGHEFGQTPGDNERQGSLACWSPWGWQRVGHDWVTEQLGSGSSAGKESPHSAGDLCSTPGLGISYGEGEGYPLHYSGLENFMHCIVHGVTESDTTEQLSLLLFGLFTC